MTGFGDNVAESLVGAAETFAERNKVYGNNYEMVGRIMQAMFPNGITLKTVEDYNRWHLFELAIVKLSRYAVNYEAGGHQDSIHDMIVYLAMVQELDRQAEADKKPSYPPITVNADRVPAFAPGDFPFPEDSTRHIAAAIRRKGRVHD